ncbi:MAG: hypothetical protein L3I99_01845 [Sulfurimonas sp.]|nr:hypothetical protein [Sulfurimonas sp.]
MSISIKGDLLFETIVPLTKFKSRSKKTGKVTEQLCTLNNFSRWGRWAKKDIKNQYKKLLREFFIPETKSEPLDKITIEFSILRHNKRKVDIDGLIYNIKFILDLLQEMKWISDDDQVTSILKPSTYTKNIAETQFKIRAYK